jgi:predicted outer membrane protein
MAHANPIQIQKYLRGIDYPASKAALIENAKSLGADETICASLEQLPDEDFQTPAEVSQAFIGPSEDNVERAQAGGQAGARGTDAGEPGSKEFLVQAMQDSLAKIELCVLTLKKSSTAELRLFAQIMIDEHSKLGQEIERLAEKKNLGLQLQPGEERQAAIEKMSLLSGSEFERRFIEQNLMDHENDLKVFTHYAAEDKDRDVKALAEMGQKILTKHLKMAKELEQKIQA